MKIFIFAVLIFIFQFVYVAYSCNGYGAKVTKVTNGKNNSATVEPVIKVNLTDDCLLLLDACININRTFESAKISFDVVKFGFAIFSEKNIDVCETLTKLSVKCDCPIVEPGRVCTTSENPINVTEFKNMLPIAVGPLQVDKVKVFYDGEKIPDTFTLTAEIFKKK